VYKILEKIRITIYLFISLHLWMMSTTLNNCILQGVLCMLSCDQIFKNHGDGLLDGLGLFTSSKPYIWIIKV
jgi:hypothetical protein